MYSFIIFCIVLLQLKSLGQMSAFQNSVDIWQILIYILQLYP